MPSLKGGARLVVALLLIASIAIVAALLLPEPRALEEPRSTQASPQTGGTEHSLETQEAPSERLADGSPVTLDAVATESSSGDVGLIVRVLDAEGVAASSATVVVYEALGDVERWTTDGEGSVLVPEPRYPVRIEANKGEESAQLVLWEEVSSEAVVVTLAKPRVIRGQLSWAAKGDGPLDYSEVVVSAWRQGQADQTPVASDRATPSGYFELPVPKHETRVVIHAIGGGTMTDIPGVFARAEDQALVVPLYRLFGAAIEGNIAGLPDEYKCLADVNSSQIVGIKEYGDLVRPFAANHPALKGRLPENSSVGRIFSILCVSTEEPPLTATFCHKVGGECLLEGEVPLMPFANELSTVEVSSMLASSPSPRHPVEAFFVPPKSLPNLKAGSRVGTLRLYDRAGVGLKFPIMVEDLTGMTLGCVPTGQYTVIAEFLKGMSLVPTPLPLESDPEGANTLPVVQVPSTAQSVAIDFSNLGSITVTATQESLGPASGVNSVWISRASLPEPGGTAPGTKLKISGPETTFFGVQPGRYSLAPIVNRRTRFDLGTMVDVGNDSPHPRVDFHFD